jgi:hypothetical protein
MWAVILVYGDNGLNAILILDDDNFPTMTTIATFICVKEIRYLNHITIFKAHSLGQPLIVRSHSKVHRSRGNPKEIPT